MKINIKKYKFSFVLLGLFIFAFPVIAAQEDKEAKQVEIQEKQMNTFCDNLAVLENRIDESVASRKAKLDELRDDKLAKLKDRWDMRSQKLDEFRVNRDEIREVHYEKLLDLVQTDEQAQAVHDFKDTIEQAVSDRRAAIDTERDSFFGQLEALIEARWAGVDQALSDLESAQDSAFSTANAACDSSEIDVKTIREDLRNALKDARETYHEARKNANNREEISGVIQAHQDKVKEIIEDFKEIARVALDELKAVFGDILDDV